MDETEMFSRKSDYLMRLGRFVVGIVEDAICTQFGGVVSRGCVD